MDHVHNWVGCFHLWQWSSKISSKRLCECETSVTSVGKYVLRQCYNKEKYIYWIYIYIPANISMAAFISGKFWSFECNISTQCAHLCRFAIDSMPKFHVEIRISIWWGKFEVDSTFKIDEISMSSPRWFFSVVPTSNRHNFCTHCFHCIIP